MYKLYIHQIFNKLTTFKCFSWYFLKEAASDLETKNQELSRAVEELSIVVKNAKEGFKYFSVFWQIQFFLICTLKQPLL